MQVIFHSGNHITSQDSDAQIQKKVRKIFKKNRKKKKRKKNKKVVNNNDVNKSAKEKFFHKSKVNCSLIHILIYITSKLLLIYCRQTKRNLHLHQFSQEEFSILLVYGKFLFCRIQQYTSNLLFCKIDII